MRKCCCCVPVLAGATVLGILGILMCGGYLAPLIAYMVESELWDPIRDELVNVRYTLDKMEIPEGFPFTREDVNEAFETVVDNVVFLVIGETANTFLYLLLCLLMVAGIHCDQRCLMIPYLVYQMLALIITIILLIAITVVAFFISIVPGIVALVVTLVISFLCIYFWSVVQRAYVEMGNRDYMYSPAPVKPAYANPPYRPPPGGNTSGLYPSAPQHFQMQEHV